MDEIHFEVSFEKMLTFLWQIIIEGLDWLKIKYIFMKWLFDKNIFIYEIFYFSHSKFKKWVTLFKLYNLCSSYIYEFSLFIDSSCG